MKCRYTDENNIVYENTESQEHIYKNTGNIFFNLIPILTKKHLLHRNF